jgi:hypothetical protein
MASTPDEVLHGLETGDYVTFTENKAWPVNGCEPMRITETGVFFEKMCEILLRDARDWCLRTGNMFQDLSQAVMGLMACPSWKELQPHTLQTCTGAGPDQDPRLSYQAKTGHALEPDLASSSWTEKECTSP